jgi:two-component system LytT family response regulator
MNDEPRLYPAVLAIRDGQSLRIVPVEELDFATAKDDGVLLTTAGGKAYRMPQSLTSLSAALSPGRFLRVHRSALLAVDRVRIVEPCGGAFVATLAGGARVRVSRRGFARLREFLS